MNPHLGRVYLAGPISGLTHDEARYGWRATFIGLLAEPRIELFSPMRGKDSLRDIGALSSNGADYGDDPISSESGVTCRDWNDVRRCDVLLACYLESGGRPSLGTAWEIGVAHELRKPIVFVGTFDDPNMHHIILRRCAGYRVKDLEQAARCVRLLLTPGL